MMQLHGVEVEDTFAEAFGMWGARIVVTADTPGWAEHAARSLTGFATSVIGCKCEAGIERVLDAAETPDGRPGVAALLFAPDEEGLGKRLVERIGMTVLTCPTTACFNGLDAEDETDVGGKLRYFGDGWQASKVLDGQAVLADPGDGGRVPRRGALRDRRGRRRREPDHPGRGRGDGPRARPRRRPRRCGRWRARSCRSRAASRAAAARSGRATRGRWRRRTTSCARRCAPRSTRARCPDGVGSVFEIVIDGLAPEPVREAMRVGLDAAARAGALKITAGNYGGSLGEHHFHLQGARAVTLTLTLREAPAAPLDAEAAAPRPARRAEPGRDRAARAPARQPPRGGGRAVRRLRRGRGRCPRRRRPRSRRRPRGGHDRRPADASTGSAGPHVGAGMRGRRADRRGRRGRLGRRRDARRAAGRARLRRPPARRRLRGVARRHARRRDPRARRRRRARRAPACGAG